MVTANKELLASHGAEIFAAGEEFTVDVLFEAAVAGGVPIVRPLRESLLVEPVDRVLGIVNGTTNYILTKMTEDGASYDDVLAEAQALGTPRPTRRRTSRASTPAAKLAILATHRVRRRGRRRRRASRGHHRCHAPTTSLTRRETVYVVKLLAVAESFRDEPVPSGRRCGSTRCLLPATHPLAAVRDSFNAVFVEGCGRG